MKYYFSVYIKKTTCLFAQKIHSRILEQNNYFFYDLMYFRIFFKLVYLYLYSFKACMYQCSAVLSTFVIKAPRKYKMHWSFGI